MNVANVMSQIEYPLPRLRPRLQNDTVSCTKVSAMSPQRRIQDGGPSVSQAYALTRSSPSLLFLRTGLFPPTIALARLCRFAFCQLASGQLRLVPRIETYPRIVAFAQTLFGRALLLLVFATLLIPSGRSWQLLALGAAACAYAGRYRRWALLATFGRCGHTGDITCKELAH